MYSVGVSHKKIKCTFLMIHSVIIRKELYMPFLLESEVFPELQHLPNSCEEHVGKQHECSPRNTEAPDRRTMYCLLRVTTTTDVLRLQKTVHFNLLAITEKHGNLQIHNISPSLLTVSRHK